VRVWWRWGGLAGGWRRRGWGDLGSGNDVLYTREGPAGSHWWVGPAAALVSLLFENLTIFELLLL